MCVYEYDIVFYNSVTIYTCIFTSYNYNCNNVVIQQQEKHLSAFRE